MKLKSIILSLLVIAAMSACKKSDDFNYPAGTVGISRIIYYPLIKINGAKIIPIVQGSSFTDPGATATLNGATVSYTASKKIDASTTPGVYTIYYTAQNPEGYTASDTRIVIVAPASVSYDPVASTNDFSGTYLRSATGVTSTWTKIATGVYTVENAGGAVSGVGNLAIVVNYSGNTISIPSQDNPYYGGTISSTGALYTVGSPSQYSWVFNAPGYGTSKRTFVKQ